MADPHPMGYGCHVQRFAIAVAVGLLVLGGCGDGEAPSTDGPPVPGAARSELPPPRLTELRARHAELRDGAARLLRSLRSCRRRPRARLAPCLERHHASHQESLGTMAEAIDKAHAEASGDCVRVLEGARAALSDLESTSASVVAEVVAGVRGAGAADELAAASAHYRDTMEDTLAGCRS